jgi:hypothetical protein
MLRSTQLQQIVRGHEKVALAQRYRADTLARHIVQRRVSPRAVQLAGLGSGAAGLLDEAVREHRVGLAMGRPPPAACRRRAALS